MASSAGLAARVEFTSGGRASNAADRGYFNIILTASVAALTVGKALVKYSHK